MYINTTQSHKELLMHTIYCVYVCFFVCNQLWQILVGLHSKKKTKSRKYMSIISYIQKYSWPFKKYSCSSSSLTLSNILLLYISSLSMKVSRIQSQRMEHWNEPIKEQSDKWNNAWWYFHYDAHTDRMGFNAPSSALLDGTCQLKKYINRMYCYCYYECFYCYYECYYY